MFCVDKSIYILLLYFSHFYFISDKWRESDASHSDIQQTQTQNTGDVAHQSCQYPFISWGKNFLCLPGARCVFSDPQQLKAMSHEAICPCNLQCNFCRKIILQVAVRMSDVRNLFCDLQWDYILRPPSI